MHILVTGICGFAGSVIVRGLLEHLPDLRITGIDNLIRKGSETNIEPLRALGIDVRVGDIRNEQDLADLPAADWVLDCAANPSVMAGVDGQTSAKELLDHNLGGTIHLLEYCRRHKAGFILLSTSRVYSIPPLVTIPVEVHHNAYRPVFSEFVHPQQSTLDPRPALSRQGITEHFSTLPPISLYGSSKKCSEILALEYGMTFNFPVWINRCGVLAGAGQFGKADQGIFSYWIHRWSQGLPLRYIGFGGKGYQVRDCLHPRDLIGLLVRQMENPSESAPRTINLSGGLQSAMSLAGLSAWCGERLGARIVDSDETPRPFDLPWVVLDSSLAREVWNWEPETPVDSILEEITQYALSHPNWLETTGG